MKLVAVVFVSCVLLLSDSVSGRSRMRRQNEWNDNLDTWQPFPWDPTPVTPIPLDDGATPAVVDGNGSLLGCNCPAPPQFNPVCGNDGVTYGNLQKLNCARSCGRNVRLAHNGACLNG
ncbi:agrin-like [Periplaneta americana]|uniref:agrin-like n=1 Tax=Periplaneta americana TaxID=6978 RepID=UPI0037E78AAE